MKKVAIVASAAGSGATTVGLQIAERLGVAFHELDALHWKPGWIESTPEELRAAVEPIVATDGWVIDGSYQGKIGQLVLGSADVVVWLDLPLRVWLPRLVRRTIRRARTGEELWDGNYESLRDAFLSRKSLILYAVRHFPRRRRRYPERFARYDVVRLRSQRDVDAFVMSVAPET